MYGNGVVTGMGAITMENHLQQTLKDLQAAPTAFCVAVAGSTSRGTAECRSGATTTPAARAKTSGSVCVFPSKTHLRSTLSRGAFGGARRGRRGTKRLGLAEREAPVLPHFNAEGENISICNAKKTTICGCRNTTALQPNGGVVGLSHRGSRIINGKFVVHLW